MAKGRKTGGGSRKGIPNKHTRAWRETVEHFLEGDQQLAERDWKKLTPRERWEVRPRLAEFIAAKLTRAEVRAAVVHLPEHAISDPAEAAQVYASIVGNPDTDLSRLQFARPAIEHQPNEAPR